MDTGPIWAELEADAGAAPPSGLVARRAEPSSPANLFLGVERPSGRRVFFVQVSPDAIAGMPALQSSRGLETFGRVLRGESDACVSTGIALRDDRYRDVFVALVEDLVRVLAPLDSDDGVLRMLHTRLARWHRFFETEQSGIGQEAQQGLYGELHFLREHLLATTGPDAVSAWVGPTSAPQDFVFPGLAVEVKTTLPGKIEAFSVASEHQLDDTGLGTLYVHHVALSHTTDGESLPEIVACVRGLVEPDSSQAETLDELLLEAGYLDSQASSYAKTRYTVRYCETFCVGEGFPRLTAGAVPSGVSAVQYLVSVPACRRFGVTVEELQSALELATGREAAAGAP